MDFFLYRDGELYCEDVSAAALAGRFGTPLYVYSEATLARHYHGLREAFAPLDPLICFSVKSLPNVAICRLFARWGSGFDVVSGGELYRVLQAGGDPERCVFAGVGKTEGEIIEALEAGVGLINVESASELERVTALAAGRRRADVAVRVNPDVDPHTHEYTTTGKRETKFGVSAEEAAVLIRRYAGAASVRLCGLHVHLGSPVNTTEPYVLAIRRCLELIEELARSGCRITALDIGGGFGAHYEGREAPSPRDYARAIVPLLVGRGLRIILEPGRSITANAGILLTRVLYTKRGGDRNFIIVDAGMTELIRPALYGAFHFIWPVRCGADGMPPARVAEPPMPGLRRADVVGPVCESADFLARDRLLPQVREGDLLAVFSAGAYGMSMASQYNSRCRAAEVLVCAADARLIRRRETYADLIAAECLPDAAEPPAPG